MVNIDRSRLLLIRKNEDADRVLGVLKENKQGLTSTQVAILTGVPMHRKVLLQLRTNGKIKHRRGIATNGRISILYFLSKK